MHKRVLLRALLGKYCVDVLSQCGQTSDCVIPVWSAGIQADMDVSARILRTRVPAMHAGMTEI